MRLTTTMGILFLVLPFSLSALDFGIKINMGISSGTGQAWNSHLDEAGGKDLSETLGTGGGGLFIEYRISPILFFSPEINLVINKGVRMSTSSGDYLSTRAKGSVELILPLHLEFPLTSGSAVRLTGGMQLIFSPELEEELKINGIQQKQDLKNSTPLSAGVVIGGGAVFRRDKKISIIVDLRAKIPFSDSLGYTAADGSQVRLKAIEMIAGTGLRF